MHVCIFERTNKICLNQRKDVSARNYIYGQMTLVLALIIGAKYINFGATVLSNFQCGSVQLIWRAKGQGPTSLVLSDEPRQNQGRGLVDHKLVQAPPVILLLAVPRRLFCFGSLGGFRCGVPLFIVMLVIY